MLLTEAILSRTVGVTNYVLKDGIDYSDVIPSLVFENSLNGNILLFYMDYTMQPEIRRYT